MNGLDSIGNPEEVEDENVIPIHEGRATAADKTPAGTQGGGPESLESKLERTAETLEAEAIRLHAASEDPENDPDVRQAFENYAATIRELNELREQQTPAIQWETLSADEKLDALAMSVGELGRRQQQLAQQQLTLGNSLMRILVKAGEINEDGTPVDADTSKGGVVLPKMAIPKPR